MKWVVTNSLLAKGVLELNCWGKACKELAHDSRLHDVFEIERSSLGTLVSQSLSLERVCNPHAKKVWPLLIKDHNHILPAFQEPR